MYQAKARLTPIQGLKLVPRFVVVVEYAGFIETSSLYNPNGEHIPYLPSFSHLARNGVLACRTNFLGVNT